MADTAGQALIRGINIDKMSRDYFNEALIMKKEVTVMSTSSREIRWYQKTSGYLTTTSPAAIGGVAEGARPFVLEQSWTRNTSYTKKYFLESPLITLEDIQDSDVRVFLENAQDIAEAVAYQLDSDIWNVVSESQSPTNINSVTATAAWDAASGQDPAEDIFESVQKIREETKRNPTNVKIYVSAKGEKDLKTWIVSTGSNFTEAASNMVMNGSLTKFGGYPIVVSENITADYAMVADLSRAAEYHEFMPMTTRVIEEEGIGRKVRAWTNGITILVKPKYVTLISNTES